MFCQKLLGEPNDTIESIDNRMLKVTNATLSQYMKHIRIDLLYFLNM